MTLLEKHKELIQKIVSLLQQYNAKITTNYDGYFIIASNLRRDNTGTYETIFDCYLDKTSLIYWEEMDEIIRRNQG